MRKKKSKTTSCVVNIPNELNHKLNMLRQETGQAKYRLACELIELGIKVKFFAKETA